MAISFEQSLANLLDASGLFKRKQWAELLMVSPAALTHWTRGETVPRPEKLNRILSFFESDITSGSKYVYEFYEMSEKPLQEVTKNVSKFYGAETVADYMITPVYHSYFYYSKGCHFRARKEIIMLANSLAAWFVDRQKSMSNEELHMVLKKLRQTMESDLALSEFLGHKDGPEPEEESAGEMLASTLQGLLSEYNSRASEKIKIQNTSATVFLNDAVKERLRQLRAIGLPGLKAKKPDLIVEFGTAKSANPPQTHLICAFQGEDNWVCSPISQSGESMQFSGEETIISY